MLNLYVKTEYFLCTYLLLVSIAGLDKDDHGGPLEAELTMGEATLAADFINQKQVMFVSMQALLSVN